jgi:hypothetical protein
MANNATNEFITHIVTPTLGSPYFARDFNEAFRTIEENFKKIVSAPYLEGQEGRSIEAVDMEIVDGIDENGYATGDLTDFGRAMVRELFSDPDIETMEDVDDRNNVYHRGPIGDGVNTGTHTAGEYLRKHPTIKVFCKYSPDTNQIEDYICSAEYYCYLDMRVEDLGNLAVPSTQNQFFDYTCQMFGEYTGTELDHEDKRWVFSKGVMLPTLYFNNDQGYFCWKINNVETGIRAQGIKGDQGRPPLAAVVKGDGVQYTSAQGSSVTIVVSQYMRMVTEGNHEIGEWGNIVDSGIQDGDLVCCLFDIGDSYYPGVAYPDMVIGNIRTDGNIYSITLPDSCRFSSLWRDYILFYACRGINYKSTTMKATKALFVPSAQQGIVHAIFQDDSKVEYVNRGGGDWEATDGVGTTNDLVIKKVSDRRLLGTQSVGNDNKMTAPEYSESGVNQRTNVKFVGYNTVTEGTSKSEVNHLPNVLLGVPVGTVVNWLNLDSVPEGWFPTGDVSGYYPPVFALTVCSETDNYDVVLRSNGVPFAYLKFKDIDTSTIEPTTDNPIYGNIFCQLTGWQYGRPITIDTNSVSINNFVSRDIRERWSMFDFSFDGNNILFSLTRQIS